MRYYINLYRSVSIKYEDDTDWSSLLYLTDRGDFGLCEGWSTLVVL